MSGRVVNHGTLGEYLKGCRCDDCRENWNAYQRKYKGTLKGKANQARQSRIHGRARSILKQRHADEYAAIVADLRAAGFGETTQP